MRRSWLTAIIVAAISGAWAFARSRFAIGGPNIGVALGLRADDHLLTGFLALSHPGPTAATVLNGVTICTLAVLAAILTGRRGDVSPSIAVAVGITTALSPFALSLLADPLGGETGVTVGVFMLLAADAADLVHFGPLWQSLIASTLVLQDTAFIPSALVYATYCARRSIISATAIIVASSAALTLRLSLLHQPLIVHGTAMRRVAVFGAMTSFVVTPLIACATRNGFAVGLGRRAHRILPILLVLVLGVSPLWAVNADPSPYLLAAQVMTAFFIARGLSRDQSRLFVPALALAMAGVAIVAWKFSRISPVTHDSVTITALNSAIRSQHGRNVCIYGLAQDLDFIKRDAIAKYYRPLYKNVLVAESITACLRTPRALTLIEDGRVRDFGFSGNNEAKAVHASTSAAVRLGILPFTVSPNKHTGMPGGRGAFADIVDTPLGKAPSVIIAAPFNVTYHCIRWAAGSTLSFAAVDPLGSEPAADPVRFTITVDGRHIAGDVLQTWVGERSPPWKYYAATLPTAARCAKLSIHVRVAGSYGIGTWLQLVAPVISAPTRS